MRFLILCLGLCTMVFAEEHKEARPILDPSKDQLVHQIQAKYAHNIQYHQDKLKTLEGTLKQILAKDPDNLTAVESNCHSRGQVWAEIQILKFKRDLEIRKALGKSDWLIYLKQRKSK